MTAYRQESGTWYVKFRYTDWTGKRRQTTKRGFKTKRDALKYEREILASAVHSPEMTVGALCDAFLADRKPRVRASTYANYEALFRRYIRPKLSDVQIKSVTATVMSGWQRWMLARENTRGKALSPATIQLANTACHALFRWAERMGYIGRSPLANLPTIGHSVRRKGFYELDEYERFLAAGKGDKQYEAARLCFDVLFYSGMRIAEFYGVGGEDLDFSRNIIHVRKACNAAGELCPVKNEQSVRDIPMPRAIMQRIKRYTKRLMELPDHQIWPLNYMPLYKILKKWANLADLPEITLHGLRHSHVSYLVSLGVPLPVISRRVGHANPSITLRVYSHFYKQDALNVGALLDNAIKCGQSVVKTSNPK